MNRKSSSSPMRPTLLVEALEPRIAPAGLLNETKFTSVVVGGSVLLDASGGPNDYQGLSTGFGAYSGTYLLYLTTGKALIFTSDLNGDGVFEPGEITGIALGVDSLGRAPNLILFSDVHGDIVTNLLSGEGNHSLTDSDNNPNNGRDGRLLLPTDIGSITLRTITANDIDTSIPGNTVANRLGLTSFSIYGNVYCGGNFGGLTIDTSGATQVASKYDGSVGIQLFKGATPQVGSIETGTAVDGQAYHFTELASNNVGGTIQPFLPGVGQHGGDISNITSVNSVPYSIGEIESGNGGGGARGGNISNVALSGDTGSYELIAGDGGSGAMGGDGGSILNFSDFGTVTGQTTLHTGAGGTGALNGGGMGGLATFGTTNTAAGVELFLGRGGDGFTTGGNGASLSGALFTSPESTTPIGSKFVGTWHDLGDVGNTHPLPNADGTYAYAPEAINFNDPSYFSDPVLARTLGDHFGDGVFSSSTPGQVVVVFGDGAGGLNDNQGNTNLSGAETVVLHVPGIVNPVFTVGDFNGDGRPDVAVASGDPNNFSGVYVFLNQIGTAKDPINSHNFSQNPLGDHPFSDALQSATPSLSNIYNVYTGPGAIYGLAAGDFNGDGITDIALVQEVTVLVTQTKFEVVQVLFGTAAHDLNGNPTTNTVTNTITGQIGVRNAATGFFYSNAADPTAAPTTQVLLFANDANNPVIRASSLTATNGPGTGTTPNALLTPEVIGYATTGDSKVNELFVDATSATTHQPLVIGLDAIALGLGKVDTDRALGPMHISSTDASEQDFGFVDLDNDGNTDVSVLTKTPISFLVTFAGDGLHDFTVASNNMGAADNAGILLDSKTPSNALTLADTAGTGQFNAFAVNSFPGGGPFPVIVEYSLTGAGAGVFYSGGSPTVTRLFTSGDPTGNQAIAGLDTFYASTPVPGSQHPVTGYGEISADTADINFPDLYIFSYPSSFPGLLATFPTFIRPLTENGYLLVGGGGGNAIAGTGGNGGAIGSPVLSTTGGGGGVGVSGAVGIIFPMDITYSGHAVLEAGSGGSGFAGGGDGGKIEGLAVRYAVGATVLSSNVVSIAGNGGNSTAGPGGTGGDIDTVSVQTGVYFAAGNGGNGATGGAGGSILGNMTGTVYDTSDGPTSLLTAAQANAIGLVSDTIIGLRGVGLAAGNGGQGSLNGGQGGAITNWDSLFNNFIGATGGSLYYASGAGGSAAAGTGGSGGAITNSSPNNGQNDLSGDLHLQTGAGGNGLTGGDGGALTTFVNQTTQQTAVPGLLSVTTGNGGIGVSGSGGSGGSITGFQANATGLTSIFPGDPFEPGSALIGVGRVIAGDGGAGFGGVGGNGGIVSSITSQTTSTPIVVAGGAGGNGLTVGGTGGSVTDSVINSAAQQVGKVLIVAGVGGNALSALPTDIALPGDTNMGDLAHLVLSFGGASPHGGDGGNVSNVSQPISTQTAVDIIAGNGGNTPNAGTSLDGKTGVGQGGSVVNVTLAGTVGAVTRDVTQGVVSNPPIQAYATTDEFGVTNTVSISAIIDLLAKPSNGIFALNDNVTANPNIGSISGNVGIVAGAAGRLRNDQPARTGVNGSAEFISAESILSIVAGSVSRVAPVNVLSSITVTEPDGVYGADRRITPITLANGQLSYPPDGQLDYFTTNLSGVDATNQPIQAGYSLVQQQVNADGTVVPVTGADGALYAITIQNVAGVPLQGPRIFTVLGDT